MMRVLRPSTYGFRCSFFITDNDSGEGDNSTTEADIVGTDPVNPNKPDGIPDKYQVKVKYSCVNGKCSFYETWVTLYNENGELDEYGVGYLSAEQIPTFTPLPGYQNPIFNAKPTTSYKITKDTVFTATCTAIPTNDEP